MERYINALWLEFSGLPAALNEVRTHGWLVFKKLVELDCEAHRFPEAIEISVQELASRCGLTAEVTAKVLEALRKKKYLRCFLPDSPEEPALFEIRAPIQTPIAAANVAQAGHHPQLNDPSLFRYLHLQELKVADQAKILEVVDLYFNHISQNMNTFILEQIEVLCRRFPIEWIRLAIDRAANHNIRSMGWVLKELIRDYGKEQKKKKERGE